MADIQCKRLKGYNQEQKCSDLSGKLQLFATDVPLRDGKIHLHASNQPLLAILKQVLRTLSRDCNIDGGEGGAAVKCHA